MVVLYLALSQKGGTAETVCVCVFPLVFLYSQKEVPPKMVCFPLVSIQANPKQVASNKTPPPNLPVTSHAAFKLQGRRRSTRRSGTPRPTRRSRAGALFFLHCTRRGLGTLPSLGWLVGWLVGWWVGSPKCSPLEIAVRGAPPGEALTPFRGSFAGSPSFCAWQAEGPAQGKTGAWLEARLGLCLQRFVPGKLIPRPKAKRRKRENTP